MNTSAVNLNKRVYFSSNLSNIFWWWIITRREFFFVQFASGSESVCLRNSFASKQFELILHVTNLFPQLNLSYPSPTVSTEYNLWLMTEEVKYEFIPIKNSREHVCARHDWFQWSQRHDSATHDIFKVRDARAFGSMAVMSNFHDPQTGIYANHFLGNVPLLPDLFLLFTSSDWLDVGEASVFESFFFFRTD